MITADQLVCHAIGDYILQSDWMANNKTKRSLACVIHVILYAVPFLLLRPSLLTLTVIVGTHFIIDRWRLARFVVAFKNLATPESINVAELMSSPTGYPPNTPPFLAVWLLIIADNIMHVVINGLSFRYL